MFKMLSFRLYLIINKKKKRYSICPRISGYPLVFMLYSGQMLRLVGAHLATKIVAIAYTVEESARSAAWLTYSSLQQIVTKFSISCPIGQ